MPFSCYVFKDVSVCRRKLIIELNVALVPTYRASPVLCDLVMTRQPTSLYLLLPHCRLAWLLSPARGWELRLPCCFSLKLNTKYFSSGS